MFRKIRDFLVGFVAFSVIFYFIFTFFILQNQNCDIQGIVYKRGYSVSTVVGQSMVTIHYPAGFYQICQK